MIVRRTLTRTEKDKRFVLGEPNLRYTASYGEFTQDRLRNPLAAALWPSPSTPTPTSSPTRRTTYQSSHKTSYADGLQYGCSKRAGERIPAPPSCAAFYLQNAAFPKWAMLGSNQRPLRVKAVW